MSAAGGLLARWGYCPACERWRLTAAWEGSGPPARCPACGTAPDPLEHVQGAVGTTVLWLAPDIGREPGPPEQHGGGLGARRASRLARLDPSPPG